MARTKGSKNKVKELKNEIPIVNESPKPKAASTYESVWEGPKPDMGHIQPPKEGNSICKCEHRHDVHYGGPKNWCNTPNCRCQEWEV